MLSADILMLSANAIRLSADSLIVLLGSSRLVAEEWNCQHRQACTEGLSEPSVKAWEEFSQQQNKAANRQPYSQGKSFLENDRDV